MVESLGKFAESIGKAATTVGKVTTSVGKTATSVGKTATSVGKVAELVGKAATSVGKAATSVGKAATSDCKATTGDCKAATADCKFYGTSNGCGWRLPAVRTTIRIARQVIPTQNIRVGVGVCDVLSTIKTQPNIPFHKAHKIRAPAKIIFVFQIVTDIFDSMKNIFVLIIFLGHIAFTNAQQTPANKPAKPKVTQNTSVSKISFTEAQLLGNWQLVEYRYGSSTAKKKSLTTCDSSMFWNFSIDSVNKKKLLTCAAIEGCKDFGFESDWILSKSNLMLKRTKIMGFGGISASGSFLIKELNANRMVLDFQKNTYVFIKK
jgi:hypothetical protein